MTTWLVWHATRSSASVRTRSRKEIWPLVAMCSQGGRRHRAHDDLNAYGRASAGELTPAERRAAFVQPSWLEILAEESDLARILRFLTPNIPEQKNTEGQGHRQLAAALELAYDDLAIVNLLDTTPSHDDNWDAQRAAETILDQLVLFLRQGDDLDEMLFRRTTGRSSRLLAINPPRSGSKSAGRNNRSKPVEPPSERWLDHLVDLATDKPLRPGALRWIYDPANTQSMMVYLRSALTHSELCLPRASWLRSPLPSLPQ